MMAASPSTAKKVDVCHFGIASTNAGGERVINGGFCLRTNLLSS